MPNNQTERKDRGHRIVAVPFRLDFLLALIHSN